MSVFYPLNCTFLNGTTLSGSYALLEILQVCNKHIMKFSLRIPLQYEQLSNTGTFPMRIPLKYGHISNMNSFLCPDKILIYFLKVGAITRSFFNVGSGTKFCPQRGTTYKLNLLFSVNSCDLVMSVYRCDTILCSQLDKHSRCIYLIFCEWLRRTSFRSETVIVIEYIT
jgi:hypothetical protein